MDPRGQTALLTGATGGIGRSIAAALAAAGAKVLASGRDAARLESLIGDLPGDGHRALPADLAEPGEVGDLAERAGEVDIFVGNAGLPGTGRLGDFTEEQAARALRVNLEAPVLLTHGLLPGMLERRRGHVVLVASLSGKSGNPRASIYNATKFGLRGFGFGLRADLHGTGVSASVVSPGLIRDAGMFADSGASPPAVLGTGTPEQVASAVLTAVRHDRVEVGVAPVGQRMMAHLGLLSPSLALRVQQSELGQRTAQSIADGQAGKK